MKRAFTLIELLVVIAIIAILAAILFPVFAQAKVAAKKAKGLAEIKQMGTATMIYAADYDDNMPLAFGTDPACVTYAGNCLNNFHAVPADWRPGFNAAYVERSNQNPVNSTQPYRKNYQIAKVEGDTETPASIVGALKTPEDIGYTYNGLLHGYSGTAINRVSDTPLWTAFYGAKNFKGFSLTSPLPYCTTAGPCRYVPTTPTCSGANGTWTLVIIFADQNRFGSHYIYGTGENWTYADTSAKFKKLGRQQLGASDFRNDPYSQYTTQGKPGGAWYDASYCHMYSFAPDWDGTVPAVPFEEDWY